MSRDAERERFEEPGGPPLWLRACPGGLLNDDVLTVLGRVLSDPTTVDALAEGDREERYPSAVIERLQAAGLPQLYAGDRATAYHQAAVCALAAQRDGGLAITLGVNSLALLSAAIGASDEQLMAVEERVRAGTFCGLLLTELEPGSNLLETEAQAQPGVLVEDVFQPADEAQATHYRLSGAKELINGGARHDLLFAFLRTGPKTDDPLSARSSHGVFFLDRQDGVRALRRWPTLPARAADISGVAFEGVVVSASQRLSPPGGGFDLVQRTLSISRGGISALASGAASRAKALSLSYARRREIYGAPLGRLGAIAEHLANVDAMERVAAAVSLRAMAWVNAAGLQAAPYTAVAKLVACSAAEEAVSEGRRVLGGRALLRDLPYERLIRDVLLYPVFDGTSHLMAEDLQMRLSMQARRKPGSEDSVALLRRIYGAAPRPLREALRGEGPSVPSLVEHSARLAELEGIDLRPLSQAVVALVGLTQALKAQRLWGSDQALRHDMAWAYAELEALCALVEVFDPDRRSRFVDSRLTQPSDPPGYRFALGLLGARACARLAARAAKAGVQDAWGLADLARAFLSGQDERRHQLIRALLD